MQSTETLTGSSESSSNSSNSSNSNSSNSSNSSAESEAELENSDSEDVERKKSSNKNGKVGTNEEPKDPLQEAKRFNQRYNLLMERINAINQVIKLQIKDGRPLNPEIQEIGLQIKRS